jgi:hypothetical protein
MAAIKIIMNSKEVEGGRDLAGTFHYPTSVPYGTHDGRLGCKAQVSDNGDGVTVTISIPEWLVLGTATIIMTHSRAIKGIMKAIDGLCYAIDDLVSGVRKDFKNLIKEHCEK